MDQLEQQLLGSKAQADTQHECWRDMYGEEVASKLDPRAHYTLVSIGSVQFAFTRYHVLVRALTNAWDAGHVPTCGPGGVAASDLLEAAPALRGVDTDLGDLRPSDVERPGRFVA